MRTNPCAETSQSDPLSIDAEIIRILPDFLWVALIVWAIYYLSPRFKSDVLPRLKTFKALGMEAEFLEARLNNAAVAKKISIELADRKHIARRIARVGEVMAGTRLLWVDDQPAGNMAESDIIEALGATVEHVTTTADGLQRLRIRTYDLILSDMAREGRDDEGAQFAKLAHERKPDIPIIFYVGRPRPRPDCAFGITTRPDELIHLVLDVMERKRS